VFTDPPYYGNVQYGELMDFCYAWLRRLVGEQAEGFDRFSTRSPDELTGNDTQGRDLAHFGEGLSKVFGNMARALKPGAPMAFTFHHNRLETYAAVGMAILDAGLTCSATLPCPAEMGGSIHIHGTGSSIVDTIFVCRTSGNTRRKWLFHTLDELSDLIREEVRELSKAGMKPTAGDIRCIAYGHLTRMAIWKLRHGWDRKLPANERLARVADELTALGNPTSLIEGVATPTHPSVQLRLTEPTTNYIQGVHDAVPF
jgi:hypothetical protein